MTLHTQMGRAIPEAVYVNCPAVVFFTNTPRGTRPPDSRGVLLRATVDIPYHHLGWVLRCDVPLYLSPDTVEDPVQRDLVFGDDTL